MAAPERGDLVWLDFNPQAGHEQAGRRPALVLTPRGYHQRYAVRGGLPDHQPGEGVSVRGAAAGGAGDRWRRAGGSGQELDRHVRRIEVAGRAPDSVVEQVNVKLRALLAG